MGSRTEFKQYFCQSILDLPREWDIQMAGKKAQNRNATLLFDMKKQVARPLLDALNAVDVQLVKECMIPRFLDCFYQGARMMN